MNMDLLATFCSDLDEVTDPAIPAWLVEGAKNCVVELEASKQRVLDLEAEVERLDGWLSKIDGGDHPCTDESKLRQWAFQAHCLGHDPEQAS